MTAIMRMNGQPRKSLAQQLDRLDSMLDGLADGLNEAVAEAVGNAVRLAVETTLAQIMNNPEILAKMVPQVPPAPVAEPVRVAEPKPTEKPSILQWAVNFGKHAIQSVKKTAADCVATVKRRVPQLLESAKAAVQVVWTNRLTLGIAVAGGVAFGLGCYLAGPLVSAACSGLAAGAIAFGVRRLFPILGTLFGRSEVAA